MNKYCQLLHNLFNFCCDRFDDRSPVIHTVDRRESRLAEQLDYLTVNDRAGICDATLYV